MKMSDDLRSMSDDEVFALVRQDNERAFDEIYDRYEKRLFAYCLTVLKDREAAADVYQTTMLTAFNSRHSYKGGNFPAWFFTIARNFCLKAKRNVLQVTSIDDYAESIPNERDRTNADFLLDEAFSRAIAELPEEFRLPIEYKYMGGFAYDEIAEMLGISLSLVKVRIFRGKKILRKVLQPYMQELS